MLRPRVGLLLSHSFRFGLWGVIDRTISLYQYCKHPDGRYSTHLSNLFAVDTALRSVLVAGGAGDANRHT